jgi:hypothetical protein
MAPELSSNWKFLQAKLKQDPANDKKLKAPPTQRQLNTKAITWWCAEFTQASYEAEQDEH